MDEKTLEQLTNEIESTIGVLNSLDSTSDEYKRASDVLVKLYAEKTRVESLISSSKLEAEKEKNRMELEMLKLKLEEDKIKLEEKKIQHQIDLDTEKSAIEKGLNRKEIIDSVLKNGITFILGAASLGITVWGARHSWKYEETDSYTTAVDKAFISRLFKK